MSGILENFLMRLLPSSLQATYSYIKYSTSPSYKKNVTSPNDIEFEEGEKYVIDVLPSLHSRNNQTNRIIYNSSSSGIVSQSSSKNVARDDEKLFPNILLYCEGMPRPKCRGLLHTLYAILFVPFATFYLVQEANYNIVGQFAAVIFMLCNAFCVYLSGLYHMGTWSPKTEILLQKLDHCGIVICSCGINLPISILLFPPIPYGVAFGGLSIILCIWNCWNILLYNRPGIWRIMAKATVAPLFAPVLIQYLTTLEFNLFLLNTVSMLIGLVIFTRRYPDPIPHICGYHEIFHVFTVIGFLSVYVLNWSVIRRTCNPYAHHLDVSEIILKSIIGSNS